MKILHIIDSGGLYGAEIILLNLVAEQVRQGIEPVIASIGDPCCGEKPLEVEARRRCLRVEAFRMQSGPNIVGAFKILRFARREGVGILHTHGYKGNILFGLMPKRLRGIPMVATLHGWTWTGGWNRMRIYEWLDRISLRFIDAVVVVNRVMLEKVRLKRLHVVNNGIPIDVVDIPSRPEEEKCHVDPEIAAFCRNGFTVGAIGRLSQEKGFDILLDAFKIMVEAMPDIRLVILGEGGEREFLEVKIRELGIENKVLMPGYVADARRYLFLFKVFVLSSLTEGLPMVILEAMQAGVPIVATRVGGIPEVLEDGESGVLVNSSDPAAIAEGVTRVKGEPDYRTRITENGKRLVREKYSIERMSNEYYEIYSGLIIQNTVENTACRGNI
jgi:glycosyltransferase involved in cell wall biosynthesis